MLQYQWPPTDFDANLILKSVWQVVSVGATTLYQLVSLSTSHFVNKDAAYLQLLCMRALSYTSDTRSSGSKYLPMADS